MYTKTSNSIKSYVNELGDHVIHFVKMNSGMPDDRFQVVHEDVEEEICGADPIWLTKEQIKKIYGIDLED